MNELTLTQELTGLSDSKAAQVKAVFQPMVKMLEGFESVYSDVMSEEQTREKSEKAKSLRLDIAKVRIKADKARKAQKEECLREGNAIQGVYNVLKFAIADKEEKLREVETHYDRIEEERIEKIQAERESTLAKYDVVTNNPHLGVMADEVWVNYLSGVKQNYEAIKEAERKTEEERIEKERKAKEEQIRIKQENEKLKAEQVSLQKEREEREAELQKEREERAKIERENQEKEREATEKKRKLDLAPDKEKLLNLSKILTSSKDGMKSNEAKNALSQAIHWLDLAINQME